MDNGQTSASSFFSSSLSPLTPAGSKYLSLLSTYCVSNYLQTSLSGLLLLFMVKRPVSVFLFSWRDTSFIHPHRITSKHNQHLFQTIFLKFKPSFIMLMVIFLHNTSSVLHRAGVYGTTSPTTEVHRTEKTSAE